MSRLRIGVIGCGSIARHRHLPEYAGNPRVEIRAVCDVARHRAAETADAYGVRAYTDYAELLRDPDIQAVSVCLPNHLHAPVAVAALQAGKHVLCEKPMATSRQAAQEMIEAARSSEKLLMIAHNQRFMAAHVKAKQMLHSGRLGAVLTFRTTFSHGGPEGWSINGAESWFFRKAEAFVGALGDLGVHKADLIRWLLEDEVASVSAFASTLEKPADVEDNVVCVLRMQSGALGTLTASWTHHPGEDNSTHLYCEHGVMHVAADPLYQVIVHYDNGDTERMEAGQVATNESQTASGVVDEFVDAIFSGRESAIPGAEGMASLQVILAALRSAQTGRAESIDS
ncbi:MAG: Gfo/Idh/MocA family protein [Bacilli bacterium]